MLCAATSSTYSSVTGRTVRCRSARGCEPRAGADRVRPCRAISQRDTFVDVADSDPPMVRAAGGDDARVVAQLLHDFNHEFDERLAVLRFRAAIWSGGLEC